MPPTTRTTFRVLSANVQSVPRSAMSLADARADLRANADDGDLVMLQEIDGRYRRLVTEEFPGHTWHVFYGPEDNRSPIACRRAAFDVLDEQVLLVHPARVGLHGRRYLTHVRLRHRELGVELHAVNVHLTPGAFSSPPPSDVVTRQAEWREGMRRHDRFVEALVASGAPVIGGGDYNRQLRGLEATSRTLAGRPVVYAVDTLSIDLLWFIDGITASWSEDGRQVFRGREGRPRRRNSDHAARQATVSLSVAATVAGGRPAGTAGKKKQQRRERSDAGFAGPVDEPFALTEFGDVNPKRVDWKTRAALEEAERRLDYRLTIVQGSYNHDQVKASGRTHDGGGVVDLLAWDWRRKVRVLREVGFAAWHRPAIPGLWGEHIHAVLVDHGRLSTTAAAQVVAYRAGRDGLKGNRVDDFPRPQPVPVFHYPPVVDPHAPRRSEAGSLPPMGRAYPPHRTLDGVDVSHHQSGRLDLTAARAAGLRWWYVKATEGTTVKDDTHARRVRQSRAAGLPVGAYHFARPDGRDGEAEARYFLEHVDLRPGDMVPMLDLEDTGGLGTAALTAWTGSWVRTVARELRRKGLSGRPVIYTRFHLDDGFGCLLWVARYSDDFRAPVIPRPWRRAAIWQHSNGTMGPVKNVPGLGRVDVNALHPEVPLSALRLRPLGQPARSGGPRTHHPIPVAPPPTVDATAPVATYAPPPTAPVLPVPDRAPIGATTVVTATNDPASGAPGSLVVTITVPLPAAPAPVVLSPDLGPVEEQLALAARSLQGAIEALPERPTP